VGFSVGGTLAMFVIDISLDIVGGSYKGREEKGIR